MEERELYEDYLGKGYHNKLRQMLTADETLLPNRIIDADLNIGGMKRLIAPALDNMNMIGNRVKTNDLRKA